MQYKNLGLKERKIDFLFIVFFSWAAISSAISDAIPTLGIVEAKTSHNFLARLNYSYASVNDPLFLHPPVWMRFVTGLSTFVYGPFYLLLVYALIKGKNWIQLYAVIYASVISVVTGVIVFGTELFGEPEWRTAHPISFLAINSPYVLIPTFLLIRMRKPEPFARKF
jgi:EXPERA (EXPanded EBP superfamily)